MSDDHAPVPPEETPRPVTIASVALTIVLTAGALVGIAVLAFAVATTATPQIDRARYLVGLFGTAVGGYSILAALYFLFGPRLALPLTPATQPRDVWPVSLFFVGGGLIVLNIYVFSQNDSVIYFWRVVGFCVFACFVTGIVVYVALQKTGFRSFGGPPR